MKHFYRTKQTEKNMEVFSFNTLALRATHLFKDLL